MKEEEKKKEVRPQIDYYIPIEKILEKYPNKYEAIIKISEEARRLFEITGERENKLIIKVLKDLMEDKDVKK